MACIRRSSAGLLVARSDYITSTVPLFPILQLLPENELMGVRRLASYKPTFTVEGWLTLAANPSVQARIAADPYSRAYPALLAHFQSRRPLSFDDALVGLHVVYGWMPTIPDLQRSMSDAIDRQALVDLLRRVQAGHVPTVAEMKTVAEFVNNSSIGGSKLLHFLNPAGCPIWDRRVARVMVRDSIGYDMIKLPDAWHAYTTTITPWLSDARVQAQVRVLGRLCGPASHLSGCTPLRLVELVLFHASEPEPRKSRRPEDS